MKYPSKVKQNDDEKQLIRWAPTVNTQEQNTWNSLFSLGVQLGYYVLALHVCWDIGPPEIWLLTINPPLTIINHYQPPIRYKISLVFSSHL